MVRADTPRARRAASSSGTALGPPKRKKHRVRTFFLVLFVLALIAAAVVVGGLAYAYAHTVVPEPKADVSAQVSIVYWADGRTELGRFAQVNRQIVPAASITQNVRDAVVAAEDRTFYTNRGISPTGIARAAWNDLRGKSIQGGSTITQQYVKNSYLTSERTMSRKLEEFLVSVKIARMENKDVILTNYLNTVYFGRNSYGIEAASRTYFRTDVSKLNTAQAAFLAGILNSPENYDPLDGPRSTARAQQRWNYVLDGMVTMGTLSASDRAVLVFPKVYPQQTTNTNAGQVGYLLQMARAEIKDKLGYTDQQIDTGGLRILTTFDKRLVDAGAYAIRHTLPTKVPSGLQVALVSIDPASGAVKAIYGGSNYLTRQRNAATQDITQAGSTFKPFALVAALGGKSGNGSDGLSLDSTFDGSSPQDFPGYSRPVSNFGNEQFGNIDLVTATEHSVNTVFVGVNEKIGPTATYKASIKAGLPKSTPGLGAYMSNVLGSASVHPIDMATAYATFAAQGVRHDHYVVQRISGPNGGELYRAAAKGTQVFDKHVMADATYAMQQVVRSGTGSYAANLGRPAAGKTGTSQNQQSAWFDGFTPQLATVVAMYRNSPDGKVLAIPGFGNFSTITGGSYPVRIWTAFMSTALKGKPVLDFPPRADVGHALNPRPTATAPASASPTPSPSGTPSPTPSPSATAPVATPTPTPTTTPTPTPTHSKKPKPTPTPPKSP